MSLCARGFLAEHEPDHADTEERHGPGFRHTVGGLGIRHEHVASMTAGTAVLKRPVAKRGVVSIDIPSAIAPGTLIDVIWPLKYSTSGVKTDKCIFIIY